MKRKLLLFCLLLVAFSGRALAQKIVTDSVEQIADFYQQSVYAELFGNGVGGSLNYERRFYLPASKGTMTIRLGGMFFPDGSKNGKLNYEMTIPLEVSFLRGKKNTKFEMGCGVTYYRYRSNYKNYDGTYVLGKEDKIIPVCRVGGRWQLPGKPYFIRLAFTPFVAVTPFADDFVPIFPWVGISFGYSFGKKKI